MEHETTALLTRLEECLEAARSVAAERAAAADHAIEERTRNREDLRRIFQGLQSARSPFLVPEEATAIREQMEERGSGLSDSMWGAIEQATGQALAWETALCDTEEALRRLWAEAELRDLAERIGSLIRSLRLLGARGPDQEEITGERETMRGFLGEELVATQKRMEELRAIPPDTPEAALAPFLGEGLARSSILVERMDSMLSAQQRAAQHWEQAKLRLLNEALGELLAVRR